MCRGNGGCILQQPLWKKTEKNKKAVVNLVTWNLLHRKLNQRKSLSFKACHLESQLMNGFTCERHSYPVQVGKYATCQTTTSIESHPKMPKSYRILCPNNSNWGYRSWFHNYKSIFPINYSWAWRDKWGWSGGLSAGLSPQSTDMQHFLDPEWHCHRWWKGLCELKVVGYIYHWCTPSIGNLANISW